MRVVDDDFYPAAVESKSEAADGRPASYPCSCSGDFDPQHSVWEADALPTELCPRLHHGLERPNRSRSSHQAFARRRFHGATLRCGVLTNSSRGVRYIYLTPNVEPLHFTPSQIKTLQQAIQLKNQRVFQTPELRELGAEPPT